MVTKCDFDSDPAAANSTQTLPQVCSPHREQWIGEVSAPGIQPLLCLHGLPILISFCILGWLKLELAMEASILSSHRLKTPWSTSISIRMDLNPLQMMPELGLVQRPFQVSRLEKDLEKGEGHKSRLKLAQIKAESLWPRVCEVTVGSFWGECQWNLSSMLHSQSQWLNSRTNLPSTVGPLKPFFSWQKAWGREALRSLIPTLPVQMATEVEGEN